MHDPAAFKRKAAPLTACSGKGKLGVKPGKGRSNKLAFANADDYVQLLDKFEQEAAAQPAPDKNDQKWTAHSTSLEAR